MLRGDKYRPPGVGRKCVRHAPEESATDGSASALAADDQAGVDLIGDPRFEVALSGWYWQITRLDAEKPEVQASRSLFAASLPRLADHRIPAEEGLRRATVNGPDERLLRVVERVVDTEGNGIYLVQVAAPVADLETQIQRFDLALAVTFALLASGTGISTLRLLTSV